MLRTAVQAILLRELGAVRRSVEVYPDDASLWVERRGLPNPGGTLVLHMAGNLQHFVGAVLGNSGYRRDRAAEFSRRGVSRADLLDEIDAAAEAVERGMNAISDDAMADAYPESIAGRSVATGDYLAHLAAHLAYHLGQLDYHRRVVTGERSGVGALAPAELPDRTANADSP